MPYIVNFTDSENKTPITVFDNTSSQDTSLTFPGRNVTGYGQIIAENFLNLLENFASPNQPVNPTEGQLWYDTTNGVLQLWDNTNWKAASNIQKSPVAPSVETSKVGELWVDTTNQQLRIYTGTRWLLVGPQESSIDGLRYGPAVETISDSTNVDRSILILYIGDQPVVIVSKDSFTPKIAIAGFDEIKAGINISTPANDQEASEFASIFLGGNLPRLVGTAANADALNVGGVEVAAGTFLRSDQVNTTDFGINVRNNSGLTIGIDGNFNISTSATAAKIYNSSSGSSVDIQTNRNGVPTTILRVADNKVGINVASPDNELDVDGNAQITGTIKVTSDQETINLDTGAIVTSGGVAVGKNLLVGNALSVSGNTFTKNLEPAATDTYTMGTVSKRWNSVYAKKVIADEIEGTINGNITGNANTATNLKNVTSFQIAGDVISDTIQFDGQVGATNKIFTTELTSNIIQGKDNPTPNVSEIRDEILVYRAVSETGSSTGLLRQSRNTFIGDLGVPIGSIMPFAGNNVPYGYLLCDGGEIERAKFPDLFDVIGTRYNGIATLNGAGTYRVPDLRGRFALGRHNMDNNIDVPNGTGGFVDNGGGEPTPARVEGTAAQTLGSTSGQSTVVLNKNNLPQHEHSFIVNSIQYSSVAVGGGAVGDADFGLGPTTSNGAVYQPNTGGIKVDGSVAFSQPVGVMNPFLTVNYIIRSGPPKFTTT
jgi:microcystin-dependent protein